MKRMLAAALVIMMLAVPCAAEEGPAAPAVAVQAPSAVLVTLDGAVLL